MLARTRRRRRGVATVEFAVVAPLLFLLVAGIVEIGRLVLVSQIATNGSREAARYAAQAAATPESVQTYTEQYMSAAGIPASALTEVTIEQLEADEWVAVTSLSAVPSGRPVRVTLGVSFDRVTWLPTRFFVSDNTAVRGATVMRKE
jgi:Flp pilus assembly protein TadG